MREISRCSGLDTLRQLGDKDILHWVIPDHARPKPVSEPEQLQLFLTSFDPPFNIGSFSR